MKKKRTFTNNADIREMKNTGWIKLNRNLAEHWLWQDAERLKWWLDLLMMASWNDRKVLHDTHLVTLRRGQMIASAASLAKRWNRSRPTVMAYLNMLEHENMISRKLLYRQTLVLTICNYDDYQSLDESSLDTMEHTTDDVMDNTMNDAMNDASTDTMLDTNKRNINNNKDVEEEDDETVPPSQSSEGLSVCKPDQAGHGKPDCKKICGFFNAEIANARSVIPPVRGMSRKRKAAMRARLREFGKDAVFEMVSRAARSDFLNGKNQRGWIATFDWLFLPGNFAKVLEGNYDNNEKQPEKRNENHGNHNKTPRCGFEVTATSPDDYSTTF